MTLHGDEIHFMDQGMLGDNIETMEQNQMAQKFQGFLNNWSVDEIFIYRNQLINNAQLENYFIRVSLGDLKAYDEKLLRDVRMKPLKYLPILERSIKDLYLGYNSEVRLDDNINFQLQLVSNENPCFLRELKSDQIGKIVHFSGIIISAGSIQIKAKSVVMKCGSCKTEKREEVERGMNGFYLPAYCDINKNTGDKCAPNPFVILAEESKYIDMQVLKIQESPENLPTGEIPRTYRILCEKYLVDQMIPGNRVAITGVYTLIENRTIKSTASTRMQKMPYVYVLGFDVDSLSSRKINPIFSEEQKDMFNKMAKSKDIYKSISQSIAPNILGHPDIKKAIACMLFGGSSKRLPDDTKLRGDINILLYGDPSTAKSQFLKFVHQVAPISVYTSGKGSSAAGLTVAIIKDPTSRDFQLEGGAFILADGGVVCIDEFDKMRPQDRVAIHEAMEQQTISVAKAGITTVLNSRTSILAAANPIFGTYQENKKISDQIDLQTTILSRFDCIFIVRDLKNKEMDRKMVDHILNMHSNTGRTSTTESPHHINEIKNYIAFARNSCSPRLDDRSAKLLQDIYVHQREDIRKDETRGKNKIPLTVRQLEAIIRISESIAKMRLAKTVTIEDVKEAQRIFEVSSLSAMKTGSMGPENNPAIIELVQKIEQDIMRTFSPKVNINSQQMRSNFENKYADTGAVNLAISNLIRKGVLTEKSHGKFYYRN
jgi:DNA replication licensing factor MCM5